MRDNERRSFQGEYPRQLARIWHIPVSGMPEKQSQRWRNQNSKKWRVKMAKIAKSTDSSSLAEVVDRILDKGIVIDAWAKVSLVGIELLSIEARVVIASVETYLKYAEAIGLTASAAAPA
jgi:hypothetical protein